MGRAARVEPEKEVSGPVAGPYGAWTGAGRVGAKVDTKTVMGDDG